MHAPHEEGIQHSDEGNDGGQRAGRHQKERQNFDGAAGPGHIPLPEDGGAEDLNPGIIAAADPALPQIRDELRTIREQEPIHRRNVSHILPGILRQSVDPDEGYSPAHVIIEIKPERKRACDQKKNRPLTDNLSASSSLLCKNVKESRADRQRHLGHILLCHHPEAEPQSKKYDRPPLLRTAPPHGLIENEYRKQQSSAVVVDASGKQDECGMKRKNCCSQPLSPAVHRQKPENADKKNKRKNRRDKRNDLNTLLEHCRIADKERCKPKPERRHGVMKRRVVELIDTRRIKVHAGQMPALINILYIGKMPA